MKVFQDAAAARDARYAAWGLKGRNAPRVRASMRIYEAPGRRTEKPFTRPARQWPHQGGLACMWTVRGPKSSDDPRFAVADLSIWQAKTASNASSIINASLNHLSEKSTARPIDEIG